MRIGTILEVSFRIVRKHWAVLLGIALLFGGPAALLTSATSTAVREAGALYVLSRLAEGAVDDVPTVTNAEVERLVGPVLSAFAAVIIAGLLTSIAALGFSVVVGADYFRRRARLGDTLRASLRRIPSAIAFILFTTLLMVGLMIVAVVGAVMAMTLLSGGSVQSGGIGVFVGLIVIVALVVIVAYLTARWAVAFPAMVIEGLGWRAALSRTWRLTADNVWRTFFMVLLGGLITATLGGLISQLSAVVLVDVVAASFGLDPLVALAIASALGTVLILPAAPVLLAVLYFDLRIRHEGVVEAKPLASYS
jgi:hypothetical protein